MTSAKCKICGLCGGEYLRDNYKLAPNERDEDDIRFISKSELDECMVEVKRFASNPIFDGKEKEVFRFIGENRCLNSKQSESLFSELLAISETLADENLCLITKTDSVTVLEYDTAREQYCSPYRVEMRINPRICAIRLPESSKRLREKMASDMSKTSKGELNHER